LKGLQRSVPAAKQSPFQRERTETPALSTMLRQRSADALTPVRIDDARPRGGLLLGLGLSLLVVVVGLVAAELGVRWILRDVTTTADATSYFAVRWKRDHVRLNAWRFRGPEVVVARPPGVYRIAVVGDSFTEGQGVRERDRFTDLLAGRLNARGGRYDVLNFGRAGAESVDHVDTLTTAALVTEPDFVLLQWYVNDVEGRDKRARPRPWRLIPSSAVLQRLRPASALYFLVNQQWIAVQQRIGLLQSYEDYMIERFGDADSPASRAAQDALERFVDITRRRGVPVGMVLFGAAYGAPSRLDFLVGRTLAFCRRERLTCVDLRPAFARHGDATRLWASRLDAHPGVLAHRVVADELMRVFGSTWRARRVGDG
jgi:hypothetical protein